MTKNTEPADRLLTINEVSELTGLAAGSIYQLVSQRRIPVVRISSRCIRFRLSGLERWFDDLTEDPLNSMDVGLRSKLAKGKTC